MKHSKGIKKVTSLALALAMIASLAATGFAADMGGMGDMGGSSEGGMAGVTGDSAPSSAAIYISSNSVTQDDSYTGGSYTVDSITTADGVVTISGLKMEGEAYEYTGVVVTGTSVVEIVDSNIHMGVTQDITGDAGMGVAVDSSSTLYITNSEVVVDGAGRYTIAAYSSSTMIVNDSTITATGKLATSYTDSVSDAASNAALLISGTSRSNFSIGATHTFYYNSSCIAEGWAALSTDSATGNGLELIAYNTYAEATNGGYGTYADSSCRDYLYAVTFNCAEIGAIISNNGSVYIGSGADAVSAKTSDGYSPLAYIAEGGETTTAASVIYAERNCFQLHSPDMMGQGTKGYQASLTVENSVLTTIPTDELNATSTKDYSDYSDAVAAYVEYVTGSVILIKSTGAVIDLTNVEMYSSNGVLIQSIINSDSMSRFLKSEGYDVEVTMTDMSVEGDIIHDDYQRDMYITLNNTTLAGAATTNTADGWYAQWAEYASDSYAYWTTINTSTYLTSTHDTGITLSNGSVWYVTADSNITSLTVSSDSEVIIVGDATLDVNGTVYSKDNLGSYSWVESYGEAESTRTEMEFSSYITVNSPGSFSSNDSEDNALETWLYYTTNAEVADIIINDSNSGKNAIIVESKANVTIDNVEINLITEANGSDTNDFTGKGTAVAAYDSGTTVTLTNSEITTAGVATMPIFVDNGATMTVENTVIISKGGTLNSSYVNTANQSAMVAPPWVLGIMGTSRASNLMGTQSTLNFLDSEAYAGAWAVLSTDSGTNMVMNIVNSTLELLNSDESVNLIQAAGGQITTYDNPFTTNYGTGYGTYVIGSVVQNVIGSTFNVGTYAAIFTGGTMNFSASEVTTYTLSNADGSTQEYTSTKAQRSAVNSDVFGFMAHQNTNYLNIEQTDITTGNAVFLIKTGGSSEKITVTVSDSTIETANNVLIQILDNEDDKIGIASTSTMAFATSYSESAGWTTSSYSSSAGSYTQTFTFSDMELSGNIYNGSGTQLTGQTLAVTLSNVTYDGAVASTSVIHIDETGEEYLINTLNGYAVDSASSEEAQTLLANQLTTIGISNYYYLGHVANLVNYNGTNKVTLSLTNGTTWYVTGTSLVYSLTISSDSEVVIVGDATLTVNGTVYSQDNLGDNMTWVATLDTNACEHNYEVTETVAATCTTNGYTVTTCANCGKTVTTTIKATGHSYVAETVENADGSVTTTYTCANCGDTYTETVYPAAQNTDTGVVYDTLQEAIDAAASGETVVLLGDVAETIVVEEGTNVTIDLGGYTITGSNDSVFTVNGTVTILNGTITGGYGTRGGGIRVYGTVTLEAGLLITGNTAYDSTSTCYGGGIYIYDGGTLIMNDGVVITGNAAVAGGSKAFAGGVYAAKGATFYMNGGYIYGNSASTYGNDVGLGSTSIWTLSMDFGTCVDAEGHLYTGWYKDSSSAVWSENNITTGSEFTVTESGSSGYGSVVYLTAGHGEDPTYPEEEAEEFAIISWPESATAAKGTEVDFTVVTTGEGVTYQWYFQTATGSKWYKSTGGTESVLTITATDARNGYKYYVVVTDAEGNSYTSEVVTLTVGVIVAQPESITAAKGETATFSVVTVDGCTYQWQYKTATGTKWYSWDGATEATFDVTAIAGRNGYSYRCKITTADGTVYYSDEAVLTVVSQ